MDMKEAVAAAKSYIAEIYADEQVTNIELEEIERVGDDWVVSLGFARPWNTVRTRAQEVLENLGAVSSLRMSYKTIRMDDGGRVVSMKNRLKADAA